jgi:hypothetical protein
MKKIVILVLALSIVMVFTACANDDYEFYGTIDSIEGTTALVNITEGEILASGDKVYVELNDSEFKIGDEIVVTYDGNVMESYPLQITQKDIKLI